MAEKFSNKFKIVFELIINPDIFIALISQKHFGYLKDVGWFNSFKQKKSVDLNNEPIPWTTYPFFDFINEKNLSTLSIFEFGSGNSTLYWSKKAKNIYSIEHNKEWFEKISKIKSENVNLYFAEENIDIYPTYINKFSNKYDIIFIDAIYRNECIINSLNKLSSNGVLILDDSEREEYFPSINLLINNRFKRLDFWGIAPAVLFKKCTTIFYKNDNCLGI